MTLLTGRLAAILLLAGSLPFLTQESIAHEFWLEPHQYQIKPGDELLADVRNGQDFVGTRFPYLPDNYRRFFIVGPSRRSPVDSRLGDYPALHQVVGEAGLHMAVLESADSSLGYDNLEAFRTFLDYHGLQHVETVHRQRALPEQDIQEIYSRFAKTLVQSGPTDESAATEMDAGLLFEIVPLQNPYLGLGSLSVTVQFQGRRLSNAQVEVFHRSESGVTRETSDTGTDGVAILNIERPGDYLINSVQLIRPRNQNQSAHWESLWASMTFQRK